MRSIEISELKNEICILKAEIERLHNLMDAAGVSYALSPNEIIDKKQYIAPTEITLEHMRFFYSLFKGRRDVYALRYVSKNGNTGYYPKCLNIWKYNLCPKRENKSYKCKDCPNKKYAALGKEAIENHLLGRKDDCSDVLGLYVLDKDGNCNFLVFDFDNHDDDKFSEGTNWIEEVTAMREICSINNIPAYIERSRSGKGVHIWVFFNESIPAAMARGFGSVLLTKGAESVNLKSFSYYDRMLPNQDNLPEGGFGNLIALPLQGRALLNGNSAFIDENWNAYSDQWRYLKNIKFISKSFIEEFIKNNSSQGMLGPLSVTNDDEQDSNKPWKKSRISFNPEDVDGLLEVIIANLIFVRTDNLKPRFQNSLRRLGAFSNPDYYKKQAMGYSVAGTSRIIYCGTEAPGYIGLPRGKGEQFYELLKKNNIKYTVSDCRQNGKDIKVTFKGKLREEQQEAADKMLKFDYGILHATTAFGKTAVGAYLVATKKVNTLVLVHNREIMKNWQEDFDKFLDIDEEMPSYTTASGRIRKRKSLIGTLFAGHNSITGIIDIVMVSSLNTKDEVDELVKNYGLVIMDECHHAGAVSVENVVKEVNAKCVYGLTATIKRDDGLEQKILMQFGPVRYRYTAKEKALQQGIAHYVYPRFTRLVNLGEKWKINKAYEEVRNSEARNTQIVNDVLQCIENNRTPLILTKYKDHANVLVKMLGNKIKHVILLQGGRSTKDRELVRTQLKTIPMKESLAVVAIGKYIGEGFNLPRLDTMMLAVPIAFEGNVEQYAGRLHRDFETKKDVVIYDYIDNHVPILEQMYHKRVRTYKKIGYTITSEETVRFDDASIIYDKNSYAMQFFKDLSEARKEIIISSPSLNESKVKSLLNSVKTSQFKGVSVSLRTLSIDSCLEGRRELVKTLHDLLKGNGINVKLFDRMHEHFAIIDSSVLWYGSMSLLANGTMDDNLIRIINEDACNEVMFQTASSET